MGRLDLDIEPEWFESNFALGGFRSGDPDWECRCVERPCRCGNRTAVDSEIFDEYDSEYLTGETDLEELEEKGLFDLESLDFESEREVNRNNPQYIRWVQQALNKSLRMNLRADGLMGPITRSAVGAFQQRQGLRVDGIVGPITEAAIIATGAGLPPGQTSQTGRMITLPPVIITGMPCHTLDRFDFDSAQLKPGHFTKISALAARIVASQSSAQPIRTIYLTGHTDPVGTDAYNMSLAQRRALQVRRELKRALEQKRRGMSSRVLILARSRGEQEPISTVAAENRRVTVCLSIKALQPQRPPASRPQVPQPPSSRPRPPRQVPSMIPTRPPSGCNRPELERRVNACISEAKKCLIAAHVKLAAGLARCRLNPVCNATQMGQYYLALRRCRESLLACDRQAKQATQCR